MGTILYTRHGFTTFNQQGRVCGSSECQLTEKGIEQAAVTAQKIKDAGFVLDYIYCSPKQRARDTAEIIGKKLNVSFETEPLLNERDFGCFEGRPRGTPEFGTAQQLLVNTLDGTDGFGMERSGETLLHAVHRIYSFLDRLCVQENADKTFLLVGHNGIARAVASYFVPLTNDEFFSYRLDNCELKEFHF